MGTSSTRFAPPPQISPLPQTATQSPVRPGEGSVERLPRLHHWLLVRPLGSGAWSRVYQARPRGADPHGPADYVVKLIPDELPRWRTAVAALEREVEVAAQVVHRNVVSVLAAHLQAMPCYTVMPYLEGMTLRQLLDHRRLPLALAFWVTRQVAEALAALHAAGWAHADIKPENILVSSQGHATLIDLGLARRLGSAECESDAIQVGTPAYMAPEMAGGNEPVSGSADIYGLGVTLAEMLARAAFSGGGPVRAGVGARRTANLLEAMRDRSPQNRPSADVLARQLSSLEIEYFQQRAPA